jgi:hypothetical protein
MANPVLTTTGNFFSGSGGAVNPVTAPAGTFAVDSSGFGNEALVYITVSNLGTWNVTDGSTGSGSTNFTSPSSGTWLNTGSASDYDIKIDWTSGDVGSVGGPADNTWVNLGTSRAWDLGVEEGSLSVTGTLSIRNASTLTVLDTGSITLSAEHFP